MVRSSKHFPVTCCCSPHPRGDGPFTFRELGTILEFSPPTWGWSVPAGTKGEPPAVLPTHVGMVREARPALVRAACSPHPRGDGPIRASLCQFPGVFSPPTWGWSGLIPNAGHAYRVLPTHVGMVRRPPPLPLLIRCSPHPRGDGPGFSSRLEASREFSPPTWGWSVGSPVSTD